MCLIMYICEFFFCKQKTAYEMRISDWSSDVCSSDLGPSRPAGGGARVAVAAARRGPRARGQAEEHAPLHQQADGREHRALRASRLRLREGRSEEHTSELQSLMRLSYAVFCLKKKKSNKN